MTDMELYELCQRAKMPRHMYDTDSGLDALHRLVKALRPEAATGEAERLKKIAGRLNGIANAMASCPGFAPIPQQLTYWRTVVEEAYDLARDAGSPQDAS